MSKPCRKNISLALETKDMILQIFTQKSDTFPFQENVADY